MELTKLGIKELQDGYKKGDFTKEEVLNSYIENIEKEDGEINAYITKTFELAKKNLNRDGLLSGIPLSLKDNISVKDVRLTCGSKILENYESPYDADVTKKVLEAGGLILGKVNMDEFAMGATTRSSYYGATKNPLDKTLIPGGSSGGSAASVAGEMAVVSVGTDTGGSTRQPASYCGIVGIKPTYGTISRYGISTMANTFDSPGTMGKTVEDATILLKALKGRSIKDATSIENKSIDEVDFDILDSNYLKGKNIAIPKVYLDLDDERIESEFKTAIEILEDLGAKINYVDMKYLKNVIETYHILVNGEISSNMARFDGIIYGKRTTDDYETIEEMFKKTRGEGFGQEVKKRIMIGTQILSLDLAEDYYYKALKVRGLIKSEMDKVLEGNMFILSPTSPILPIKLDSQMTPVEIYKADMFTIPANMAGCPSLSVPMNKKDGLSVGIQFTGRRMKDNEILNSAYLFERSKNEL